jgi:hypothetical protein
LRGRGRGWIFRFLLFPSSSSHVPQVPNVVAKTFPIAPLFLSHIVRSQLRCLWVGKEGQREAWQIMLIYIRECPVFQNSGDGPITWLLLKKNKKIKKIGHTPHQLIEAWNKTNQGTLSACWAFPLTAWNFYFQNCSSPFLAWANTSIINWGYLFHASINWWGVCPIFLIFFRRSHVIGPSPLFWNTGHSLLYVSMICHASLWPSFPTQRHRSCDQTIWDRERGAIGNVLANTLGTWGTCEELDGNRRKTKNPPPSSPLQNRKIKAKLPWAFSLGCMKFLFPKRFVTIFNLN